MDVGEVAFRIGFVHAPSGVDLGSGDVQLGVPVPALGMGGQYSEQ